MDFGHIFDIYDDFSKVLCDFGALHFEKSSKNGKNLAKNEENPYSTCLFQHIFRNDFGYTDNPFTSPNKTFFSQ